MYRHSPADMLTYGALASAQSNPANRFTKLVRPMIRSVPVRNGVGTQTSSAWRIWVKFTAFVVPPFVHATLIAALSYVTFRDVLPRWLALSAACGIWAMLVWFGNILLDRHLFKRLIWLRRAVARSELLISRQPIENCLRNVATSCANWSELMAKRPVVAKGNRRVWLLA